MANKKVTILSSTPPVKGISKYSAALIESLAQNNDVEVLSFSRMYPELLYSGGTKDSSLKPIRETKGLTVRDYLTWYNPFGWIHAGLTLKGDVLHVQWWTYVLTPVYITIILTAKLIRQRPIVITMHNVRPHEGGVFKVLANKLIVALGDRYIVHTANGKEDFIREYKKSPELVHIVPHGILMPDVPLQNLTRREARRSLGISPAKKVILFFGIIREYKGLDVLIKALARIREQEPDAYLVIAGKPWESWRRYESLIKENDLEGSVKTYLGFVPEGDIETYFRAADIVALPYKHFDAQSGAGTLALPFGRAMIVTNTGGLPVLVGNNKDAIVEAGDGKDLAVKITRVITDRGIRRSMENESVALANKLSWKVIAMQTIGVYKEVLNDGRD